MHLTKVDFLDSIFHEILSISEGKCTIDDKMIYEVQGEKERKILMGIKMMHEDLELAKGDMKRAMQAEFDLKLLETKNNELEQFVYVASHDLQEPLRTIINFSKLIERNYSDQLDDDFNQYFNYIIDSSTRMSMMIKSLLDYSRLGLAKEKNLVDFNDLVSSVLLDLDSLIQVNEGQVITSNLPTMNVHEVEMRLLLQNLIGNALKFRKKNVKPIIRISASFSNNSWTFAIVDNGIGIKSDFHDKIFLIFKKLNNKSEYEGTGIGLAQCKKIIELHNGTIWLESSLGKGSIFFFKIPI